MTLEGFRCFCAIIECGSFHAAAARLHRSQPAVSQQIKALEREAGHMLLERRTCTPTPAGQRLYARASAILGAAESLVRELADLDEADIQALHVGTSDTTALYVLPPVVRAFAKAMPRTRLALVNRPSSAIAEQVARGELHLGIVTLPVERTELEERELFQEELVLVAPRRWLRGKPRQLCLADLAGEPFLLLDETTRTGGLLREHFRREGFEPQIVLDSGSFEVIKRYVAEGVGLSFLPSVAIQPSDRALERIHVSGLPPVRIGAIWRRGAYQTRAEQAFLKHIHASIQVKDLHE